MPKPKNRHLRGCEPLALCALLASAVTLSACESGKVAEPESKPKPAPTAQPAGGAAGAAATSAATDKAAEKKARPQLRELEVRKVSAKPVAPVKPVPGDPVNG